jgi:hypothetical protein
MDKVRRDTALASLLWGAVAAVGEYTMLFLTIIQRIHVRFENEAPVFFVDPRGPIILTKDVALSTVWAVTVAYGILVTTVFYLRPRPRRAARVVLALAAIVLAAVAALAEPLWGLIVLADFLVLYPLLRAGEHGGAAD